MSISSDHSLISEYNWVYYNNFIKLDNILKEIIDNTIIYYRLKLSNEKKIPLYIMVGVSNTSFLNNLKIIENNIDKIKEFYSEIIFFNFNDEIETFYQKTINKKESVNINFSNIKDEDWNKNNFLVNDYIKKLLASHYNEIINLINVTNQYQQFDIIGVSFGGGVTKFISQINSNIRNLILMAPGIFEGLKNIPKNINIILGWCIQDTKIPYNDIGLKLIKELEDNFQNYKIVLTDLDNSTNTLITHRLQNEIFEVLS
jgi:hypothetical protein